MSRPAATEILADLRHRGIRIRADGERLHLKAPPGAVSAGDRDALARHKGEMLAQLEREDRLLGFSLTEFERSGCSLEVDVPGLNQTLWFVPRDADAEVGGLLGVVSREPGLDFDADGVLVERDEVGAHDHRRGHFSGPVCPVRVGAGDKRHVFVGEGMRGTHGGSG